MQGKKRYIQLEAGQRAELEQGYKRGKRSSYRQRCHIILLSAQGYSISEIGEIINCSRQRIYSCFNRYESSGIQGLDIAPGGGRPPIFKLENQAESDRVKEIVSRHPQQLKQALPLIEQELHISTSKSTLVRFLKKTVGHTSVCAR
jgi:transposase